MLNGSKVKLTTGHSLTLTTDHRSSEVVVSYGSVFHYINYVSFHEKMMFFTFLLNFDWRRTRSVVRV
jgi:hypothetical protein